jgi:hypothetical protein
MVPIPCSCPFKVSSGSYLSHWVAFGPTLHDKKKGHTQSLKFAIYIPTAMNSPKG